MEFGRRHSCGSDYSDAGLRPRKIGGFAMTTEDDEGPIPSSDAADFAVDATEEQVAWVRETATIRGGINLHSDNVIGIFGKVPDLRAILRRTDGSTLNVKIGDAALGGQVRGIDENTVVIVKNDKITLLRLRNREFGKLSSLLQ